MNKNDLVIKAKEMVLSISCCPSLKAMANAWIASIGTDEEYKAAKELIAELREDIMSVDDVIAFMQSDTAIQHLGARNAASFAQHAKEIKKAGGEYCDCPACRSGLVLLQHEKILLKT